MAKNWDQVSSRWTRFSRDVKKKWGDLTDNEIMEVNGRRGNLAEKIQAQYEITLEEANQQIDAWLAKLRG